MDRVSRTNQVVTRLVGLGEVVRLRVLRLLEAEELSVGEVAKVVQLPQSTVSRHLKILAEGGWVQRRSEGTATLYAMSMDDIAPECRSLWRAVREQMGETATLEEDARRLRSVLEDRKTDSASFFGRHGGRWDEMRAELFGSRFTPLALMSLLNPEWVVADLGCGTGNVAELVAGHVKRVVAVDTSGTMLESARRRLAGLTNVEFKASPIHDTGLAPKSVDVAVACLVMHHHPLPKEAVLEMRRIVKAGGMAVVIDMVRHDREEYRRLMGHEHLGFGREEMIALLKGCGFESVRYRELPPEPEAKGPGLFVVVGR